MDFESFVKLTRIEHALILCAAVLVGQVIALHQMPADWEFVLLTFIPPFFIEIASFAINDYFDVEVDRKNNRMDRPLVNGRVKPGEALALSVGAALVGVGASWFINFQCFLLCLGFASAAFLYSWKLKNIGLVGNSYVAATMAIPFVYGNLSVFPSISESVGMLALIAFLAGLAREVMGAVRDLEGDRLREGAATFPMLVGGHNALNFCAMLYAGAILLSFIPFFIFQEYESDMNYLLLVAVCDVILAWVAARGLGNSKEFMESARAASLAAMVFGMLGFLLGSLY